jgi:glycosyltransferase involved in cell wall biosynthesis
MTLGGLGRQAVLLTERLSRLGVPLFVIARRMEGTPGCSYDPQVEIAWVRAFRPAVHILEEKTLRNLLTSISFSFGALYLLWKRRKEYQLVHFYGASVPLMICIIPLKLLRKKVIAMVAAANLGTEAGSLRGRYGPLGRLLISLIRKVDCFIAISSEIERGLIKDQTIPDRIVRIPICVEDFFKPASEAEKAHLKKQKEISSHLCVTFSGRLVDRKGLRVLLMAWRKVQDRLTNAGLIILGDGPARREYENLAHELGLNGTVEFRGLIQDVSDYLRASDLFVLPSFQEGLPGSLLEAMACGLPVVASRIGGVEDVVKPEHNGLLSTPGNPDELGRAVIRLLQDREEAQRLGREAAKTIQEDYSIEKVAQQYLKVYRKLGIPALDHIP